MARWRPAASSLRAAFIAASIAWAVLLVAAPWLASRAHASPLASLLIVGVYSIGSLVCHQLPERSYHLWSAQMPVCARCAGIYAGAVFGALGARAFQASRGRSGALAVLRRSLALRVVARGFPPPLASHASELRRGLPKREAREGGSPARVALAVAVTPTMVTLVYEWTTGVMPAHAIRAAAGAFIGLVVAWLVVATADNQVN